jgi:predicted HicB family RNase H-like nuclease
MRPYKGYAAAVAFDEDDRVFHGRVLGVRDVVTFEAETAAELVEAFHDSVDDYLAFHRERGTEPERPFSGTLSLRLAPELHRSVAAAAGLRAKSVNQWIAEALDEAARRELGRGEAMVKG